MKNEGHAPDLEIISMYIKKSVLKTYQEDNNQWEDLRSRGWWVYSCNIIKWKLWIVRSNAKIEECIAFLWLWEILAWFCGLKFWIK